LGTAIIDRGRNIISCSRDGTARLWDVSQQNCITDFKGGNLKAFNDITLIEFTTGKNPVHDPNPKEVSTEGKVLLVASEDKNIMAFDIRAREQIFTISMGSPVNNSQFYWKYILWW